MTSIFLLLGIAVSSFYLDVAFRACALSEMQFFFLYSRHRNLQPEKFARNVQLYNLLRLTENFTEKIDIYVPFIFRIYTLHVALFKYVRV